MISREDVLKLAALSRLKLSEDEVVRMQEDMGAILAYVDTLKAAPLGGSGPVMSANKNVLREDASDRKGGEYTEKLLGLAPRREGEHLKVKKILGSSQ